MYTEMTPEWVYFFSIEIYDWIVNYQLQYIKRGVLSCDIPMVGDFQAMVCQYVSFLQVHEDSLLLRQFFF